MYDLINYMKSNLKQIFYSRQKLYLEDKNMLVSAVLIPLFQKDNDYHVLLTRRSNQVAHHKGQISFPGGKQSKRDSSLLDTALRECWEEIGLEPKDVEILGELDDVITLTSGFIITPFVAIIPHPYEFTINPFEIDEIIYIPFSSLLEKSNFKEEPLIIEDKYTITDYYIYNGNIIWGATARILKQLLDELNSSN